MFDLPPPALLPPDLCARLQLSCGRAETSRAMTEALVAAALERGIAGVGVFPVFVAPVAKLAAGRVAVVAKVGGAGLAKPTLKAIEATSAIKDGAAEVQVEPLLAPLLAGDVDAAKQELLEIVRACRATGRDVMIHAVLRSAALMRGPGGGEGAVERACRAIREGACDGVVDVGDDASHAVVRTHAHALLLRRQLAGAAWPAVRASLRPGVDRVEVFVDLAGIQSGRVE